MKILKCSGCERPIVDRFLVKVEGRDWHVGCLKCWACHNVLTEKCFSREGKLYCRQDFFRLFGTKCGGCAEGLLPTDLVRRARGRCFHVSCFRCLVCRRQVATGEQLVVLQDGTFVCAACDDDCQPKPRGSCPAANMEGQQPASLGAPASTSSSPVNDAPDPFDDDLAAPSSYRDSGGAVSGGSGADSPGGAGAAPSSEGAGDEGGGPGGKRRGPRTTIKAKQLETLKAAFSSTPKPTRHIREQLAAETGLNMRVIQVWFQNRRSKERRMKQVSTMGARRNFFRSPRRAMRSMRGGPGDEGPPHNTFSYFSDSNSPNEFGGYAPCHGGVYDYYPHPRLGELPGGVMEHHHLGTPAEFPGTVPIMDHHHLGHGVPNLGSEGPFVTSDCLGSSRTSPEHPVNLSERAPHFGGATPDGSAGFTYLAHAGENRVW